jgi:hypothetical protein
MIRQHVAAFRAQNAGSLSDPWILEIVDELRETQAEFPGLWNAHEVGELANGHETLDHPFAGRLYWDFVCVVPADHHNLTVRVHQGDRAESCERLEELNRQWRKGQHTAEHNIWVALGDASAPAASAFD